MSASSLQKRPDGRFWSRFGDATKQLQFWPPLWFTKAVHQVCQHISITEVLHDISATEYNLTPTIIHRVWYPCGINEFINITPGEKKSLRSTHNTGIKYAYLCERFVLSSRIVGGQRIR